MALTITVVKRFKPQSGVRRGLVDITFDDSGPSWTVAASDFGLNGLWDLRLPAAVDGFVLGFKAATPAIEAWEEADGAGALQACDASDLNTKVVRAEYIGY